MRHGGQEEAEVALLLEAMRGAYGYDFTGYTREPLRRLLSSHLARTGIASLAQLRSRILEDGAAFGSLLDDLTIKVTQMFRDPDFYAALRSRVAPVLRARARLKLWIAGCATGEEAHSAAIMLHEEGLLERTLIYATDVSPVAVRRAREGIHPADRMRRYAEDYRRAGGTGSFTSYFTVAHGYAAVRPLVTRNVVFAVHDLARDGVFGEMDAVLCRNVLIYFDRELQEHALGVLCRSLAAGGFLCLGRREHLRTSAERHGYEAFAPESRIFRKRLAAEERAP